MKTKNKNPKRKIHPNSLKNLDKYNESHTAWNKGKHLSEEHKRKIGLANKGKTSWLKGKKGILKHSKETRKLISLHNKAHTKEVKEKNRQWHLGRKQSKKSKLKKSLTMKKTWQDPEYKSKHHEGMLGLQNALGTKQSKETIQKRMKKVKKKFATKKYKELFRENRLHQVFPQKDTKPERMLQLALDLYGIKYDTHFPLIGQPDIVLNDKRIAVFVDGDYWHANPERFSADDIIHGRKASEIWAKDIKVNHKLTQKRWHVVRVWESDIMANAEDVAKNIIALLAGCTCSPLKGYTCDICEKLEKFFREDLK